MTTVSILTPSFNYRQFMTTTMVSVSGQLTSRRVEHLVSDGGSTDGTVELLRAFKSQHELLWWSEQDRGQSDDLNKALRRASGELVGWLNADDFYLPGAIESVSDYFQGHPEVGVVYGDVVMTDEVGRVDRLLALYGKPELPLRWRGCMLQSTAAFFRRDVLGEDPWDPQLRTVMDWDLFLGLQRKGVAFAHLRRPLAGFRLHGAQVTHGLSSRITEEHVLVRERHRAAPRAARAARPVGDVLHATKKWRTGSYGLERRVFELRGLPLLNAEGVVDKDTWRLILETYGGS